MKNISVALPAVLLLLLPPSDCFANDPPEKLSMAAFYATPSTFSKPVRTDPNGALSPNEGIAEISPGVYDIKEFLEALGVAFPEGAEALFRQHESQVIVRNTADNIFIVESLLNGGCRYPVGLVRAKISLITLDKPPSSPSDPAPSFTDLKNIAGGSWKEIAGTEITTRSGRHTIATISSENSPQPNFVATSGKKSSRLPRDFLGSNCELEVIVGPDFKDIDVTISYRFRGPLAEDDKPFNVFYDGETSVWEGYPQILQVVDGTDAHPAYALIIRCTVMFRATFPIQKLPTSSEE